MEDGATVIDIFLEDFHVVAVERYMAFPAVLRPSCQYAVAAKEHIAKVQVYRFVPSKPTTVQYHQHGPVTQAYMGHHIAMFGGGEHFPDLLLAHDVGMVDFFQFFQSQVDGQQSGVVPFQVFVEPLDGTDVAVETGIAERTAMTLVGPLL